MKLPNGEERSDVFGPKAEDASHKISVKNRPELAKM